jgi:TetR/AcrR family tetracycline transcriptional repressor
VTDAVRRRSDPLTRELVVDAAQRLVEEQGIAALSMRRLAAELGVAVTAIYWHVGNRDALLDELVDRIVSEIGAVRASGSTPHARIASIARSLRRKLLARPDLVGLAHERGRTSAMFQPAEAAIARELVAAGRTGEDAALAVKAIEFLVIGSVILERAAGRGPRQRADDGLWRNEQGLDPSLVARLAAPPDHDEVFETSLRSLVAALVDAPTVGARHTTARGRMSR